LTTAGRVYLERCNELLARLRDADETIADMSGAVRGTLHVSAPPTWARRRIAPLLPAFFTAHPELRLEIALTGVRADVVGSHVDLVVRLGPLPDSTLACRILSTERFVLCASPHYLRAHGVPASVGDLARHRCLATQTFGLRSRWSFRRSGSRARVSVLDVDATLRSDDLGLLHDATRAGVGVAALPEYLVADDLASGALTRLLPHHRLPSFRAYAVLPSGRHVPRRVRAFVDFLAAAIARPTTGRSPVAPAASRSRVK
jgi:DNA-binding transcriptional LysR family regulator